MRAHARGSWSRSGGDARNGRIEDLATLYPIWQKHATGGMTESARNEGTMVVALLDSTLGPPTDSLSNYERYAPVTTDPASVASLTGLAIRL